VTSLREQAVRLSRRWWFDSALALGSAALAPLAKIYARSPERYPRTSQLWDRVGTLPVDYHYYQPIVRPGALPDTFWQAEGSLPGLGISLERQLDWVAHLAAYSGEFEEALTRQADNAGMAIVPGAFGPGDLDVLYSMVRHLKPSTVVEVGAGHSTRAVVAALQRNRALGSPCRHVCIEPYEMPWLEALDGVTVVRRKVEDVSPDLFQGLGTNDILFVDSSHVLRVGGDVEYLYLVVLPSLASGVTVHIHDIFLPRPYPREWVERHRHFWTEQQFLQAFLAFNDEFEVLLMLNYLSRHHRDALTRAAPTLASNPEAEPGSFWMRRRGSASEPTR
jgi:hypothetical protein